MACIPLVCRKFEPTSFFIVKILKKNLHSGRARENIVVSNTYRVTYYYHPEKAKPIVRWGRKATGVGEFESCGLKFEIVEGSYAQYFNLKFPESAGLPGWKGSPAFFIGHLL